MKAAKRLICKTIGEHRLTAEDYQAILADVEAVLTSPLICHLDSLPDDGLEALTPGHFLVGRLLTALPQPKTNHQNLNRFRRWNLCQCLVSEFWKSLTKFLQKLARWKQPQQNFHPCDIVLLKDQDLFLSVEEIHPEPDGYVHAVTVRTNRGQVTRPIH